MTRNDSDWVSDLFAASTHDWTPASAKEAVRVLYMPVSRDAEISRRCASVLSDSELHRADRFLTQDSGAHFIQRRAFRRYCGGIALGLPQPLSQIIFRETDKGRPYLPNSPNVWFSFSSCRLGFLGAWSPAHGIGVDLEDQSRNLEATELARRYYSLAEAMAVGEVSGAARQQTFLQLWNLKEAALKSIGEGLPFGLDAFEFELTPMPRVVRAPPGQGVPERFTAHLIGETGCCAALVIRSMA